MVGGLGGLDPASSHVAQHQEPAFTSRISFILPQLKFYKAGVGWGVSCFLSRGHTSGVCTKTKWRSKGCQSRYLPEPSTVCTGDKPSPLRHPQPRLWGHRAPPGVRGRLKGIGGRGPLFGAVG